MNKGELRTHFKNLLNRSDCSDDLADTFMDQSITRIERSLRIPPMEKSYTYTLVGATTFLGIPSDFLEINDFYMDNTNLSKIPLAKMVEIREAGESGTPRFFSREGSSFLIYPYPSSGSIKLNYYAGFTAMTSDTDENDLALIAPDLIVYGMLSYAGDYYLDDRTQLFEQRFGQLMSELQQQQNDAETSGTVQVIQPTAAYLE